jgi:hypothetical protein
MAVPPDHSDVDDPPPEENDNIEDRFIEIFTVVSGVFGSIVVFVPAGLGLIFGVYGFLRQFYQYIQKDEWVPYSVNDLLDWHNPQDWVEIWEVLNNLHPIMLVLVAFVISSVLNYIEDVLTMLFILFKSRRDSEEINNADLRLVLFNSLIPPAPVIIIVCAMILYTWLNGEDNGLNRNSIWVYALAVCGILGSCIK